MAANIASTLEGALLGNADVQNAPDSLFLDAAHLSNICALTKANVQFIRMETVLAANVNFTRLKNGLHLMNPAAYSKV